MQNVESKACIKKRVSRFKNCFALHVPEEYLARAKKIVTHGARAQVKVQYIKYENKVSVQRNSREELPRNP